MSGKALLFVEEGWQVDRVRDMAGPGSRVQIIGVSPEACYALERAEFSCRTVEDYYSPADVIALAFKVSHPRLDEICRYADAAVEAESAICQREGLKPFEAHQYKLMPVLDSVALAAFVLTRIMDAENPGEVLYFPTESEPLIPDLVFRAESIYSHLIPIFARSRGAGAKAILQARDHRCGGTSEAGEGSVSLPWRSFVRAPVKRLAGHFLARVGSLGRFGMRSVLGRGVSKGSSCRGLLVLDVGFDIDPVLECLYREGAPSPIFWKDAGTSGEAPRLLYRPWGGMISLPSEPVLVEQCAAEGRRCAQVLWTDSKFRGLFELEGVDLFPVVERRLAWLLERNLPRQLDTRLRARALLSRWNVGAVLATDITSFARVEVARAAREVGVPVIVYQHGGAWGYFHSYAHEITALKWADYFLAYGDGVAAFFNEKATEGGNKIRARSIPVGSTRLDVIKKGVFSRRKTQLKPRPPSVVYVCHRLTGRNRRIPYCEYDSNRYWQWQKRIIEVFRRHPEIRFIIRPFPANQWHNPMVEYMRALNLSNCRVETSNPFSSLVGEADLFLLDFDGTSMLEALTTQKPIIVFAERESTWIHPRALELLEKRVAYARSLEEYLHQIEEALGRRAWREPATSDEFLKAYGTYTNDGGSAKRAATVLQGLMRGSSVPRRSDARGPGDTR